MTFASITSALLSNQIVESNKSAKITAVYAVFWMRGSEFDFENPIINVHRVRLLMIGIDIRTQYVQAQP
ncbi:phage/plasmid replication domain-containing protein [Pseudomonas sp. P2758]|uniref:phage/plasmid replication domain-containing protein n=1 Tax=Pseudomonas sp. P2758 TaxID=3409916 RepID=UPI003B594224